MKKKFSWKNLFKIVIPVGILIAITWQFLQISFFTNGIAQPGMTSFPLFSTQIIFVNILLFFSFKIYQNQNNDNIISFGKYLQLGFLIGIVVAVFGIFFFQIFIEFINPNYETWLQEMYLQSWTERGLSDTEIQKQLATNIWLKTMSGMIYNFCFVVGLMTLFSIFPAFLASRNNRKNVISIKQS